MKKDWKGYMSTIRYQAGGQRERKYAPVKPEDGEDVLHVTWKMIGAIVGSWLLAALLICFVAYLGHKFNW